MHEALQDAVAVLRPEVDELAQRLLVEISAASGEKSAGILDG
jgi:hypothetical protein